jgi:hypothetical protein
VSSTHHGCWDHSPYAARYMPTVGRPAGAICTGTEYWRHSIPNRFAQDCQYTKTALGRTDSKCAGCRWRQKDIEEFDPVI